jgi:hypothetical protein
VENCRGQTSANPPLIHVTAVLKDLNGESASSGRAEVNERIGYSAEGATSEFVCECSNTECSSTIELTVAEYERVRSNPTWFVIKADHDLAQIERVVSRDDGYGVVEKLILEEYMQETDPRSDGSDQGP